MPAPRLKAAFRTSLMISGAAAALILGACREEDLARALSLPLTGGAQGYGGYGQYPAYGPAPIGYPVSYDDAYAWAERSYALDRAFYDTAPDYGFDYRGVQPWVWETGNDWSMYADPWGDDYRYYYYEPNRQQPYFIRDDQYGYGFDNMGRLVAIYDLMGRLMPNSFLSDRSVLAGDYYRRAYDLRRHRQTVRPFLVDDALWRAREPYIVDDYNDWLRASQYEPWRDYRRRTDGVIVRAFEDEARKRKFHPGFPAHAKGWGPPFLREDGRRIVVASVDDRWYDDGRRWPGNDGRWFFNDRDDRRFEREARPRERQVLERAREDQRRWEERRREGDRRFEEARRGEDGRRRQLALQQQQQQAQREFEARREADQRRAESRAREEQRFVQVRQQQERRVAEARRDDQQRREAEVARQRDEQRRWNETRRVEQQRQQAEARRGEEQRRQAQARQEQARRDVEARRSEQQRQQVEARRGEEQRRQVQARQEQNRRELEARRNEQQRAQFEARRNDQQAQRQNQARQEQGRRDNEQRQQAQARENQRRSEEARNRGRPDRQEARAPQQGGGDRGRDRERRAENQRGNGNGNGRGGDRG